MRNQKAFGRPSGPRVIRTPGTELFCVKYIMAPLWLRKRLNKGYTPGVVSGLRRFIFSRNFNTPARKALNDLKRGGSYENANRTLQEIRARNEAFRPYSNYGYKDTEMLKIARNFTNLNKNINTTLRRIQNLKNARLEAKKKKLIQLKNNVQRAKWSPYYNSNFQAKLNSARSNLLNLINKNNGSGYNKLYSMYLYQIYRHAVTGNRTTPYH